MHLNSDNVECSVPQLNICMAVAEGQTFLIVKCDQCSIHMEIDCDFMTKLSHIANTDVVRDFVVYGDPRRVMYKSFDTPKIKANHE